MFQGMGLAGDGTYRTCRVMLSVDNRRSPTSFEKSTLLKLLGIDAVFRGKPVAHKRRGWVRTQYEDERSPQRSSPGTGGGD